MKQKQKGIKQVLFKYTNRAKLLELAPICTEVLAAEHWRAGGLRPKIISLGSCLVNKQVPSHSSSHLIIDKVDTDKITERLP